MRIILLVPQPDKKTILCHCRLRHLVTEPFVQRLNLRKKQTTGVVRPHGVAPGFPEWRHTPPRALSQIVAVNMAGAAGAQRNVLSKFMYQILRRAPLPRDA